MARLGERLAGLARMLDPLGRLWSAGWLPAPRSVVFGGVAACAALLAAVGALHVVVYGHDTFFLLGNGWRALQGQRVHVDYVSGFGPVTFLLVAAGMAVSGAGVASPTYANVLAMLVTGSWAAWLAVGRSRTLTAAAYAWFVTLLAGAPFALGDSPFATSYGMVYNRYGYALLAVVILEAFQPPAPGSGRGRRIGEPILTGAAVSLMLFLKANYFVVALPWLAVSLCLRDRCGQRALAYAFGMGATALVFLAYLRFQVAAMVSDLTMAAQARALGATWQNGLPAVLAGMVRAAAPLALLVFGCAWLRRRRPAGEDGGASPCHWLAALAVVGTDLILLASNAQRLSFPLTGAFALLLLFAVESELLRPQTPAARVLAPALVLLAGLLAAPVGVRNAWGLGYAFAESRFNPDPPGELRFESARLRPLVLRTPADDPDNHSNGREYVNKLNDGIRLLTASTEPSEKVTTLDAFEPFAYALERAPIRGGMACAADRYTLDERHHPTPERLFGDAAVIMVPKRSATPPRFYTGLRAIYEPALQRDFRLAAESESWWLYRRASVMPSGR